MFIIKLKPLYNICDKIVIRNLRNRRTFPLKPNPGLDGRINAYKETGININAEDAEEFIEKSESDFINIGEAYNEHTNETLIGKYELRHHIIKEKYFKENMPNLLTWSEKEQIRHLANTLPNEWTPEKIAESFPVTVPVVKKLLKYPWKPANEQRIARHDASVMRNWRELKESSLSVPEDLRQHLLKFSNRTIPPLNKSSIKVDLTQERKMGEFEKIIQRCAEKERISKHDMNENINKEEYTENVRQNKKRDVKRMTFEELRDKLKRRVESGEELEINEKIIVNTVDSNSQQPSYLQLNSEIELPDAKESELMHVNSEKAQSQKNIMAYPERIRIPKKSYKKGATYKVNDCYYDHDGRFLYRVLGLS